MTPSLNHRVLVQFFPDHSFGDSAMMLEAFIGAFFGFMFSLGLFYWQIRVEFKKENKRKKSDSINYFKLYLNLSMDSLSQIDNYLQKLEISICEGGKDYYANVRFPEIDGGIFNVDLLLSFSGKELFDSFGYSETVLKHKVDPFHIVWHLKNIKNELVSIKELKAQYSSDSDFEAISFLDKIQNVVDLFYARVHSLAETVETTEDEDLIQEYSKAYNYVHLYAKVRDDGGTIRDYLDVLSAIQSDIMETSLFGKDALKHVTEIRACKNHAFKKSMYTENCIQALKNYQESISKSVEYLRLNLRA